MKKTNIYLLAAMFAGVGLSSYADDITTPTRMNVVNINSTGYKTLTVNISDLDSESNLGAGEYTTIEASTTENTAVSADIDDYQNKALAVYSSVYWSANNATTLTVNYGDSDRTDDNMNWTISATDSNISWTPNDTTYFDGALVLSNGTNGGLIVFNVYDNLTINALQNEDNSYTGNTALYMDDKAQFNVKTGATVIVNGDIESGYTGVTDAGKMYSLLLSVESDSSLTVNGDVNTVSNFTVAGTANINGDANFGNASITTKAGSIQYYAPVFTITGDLNITGDTSFTGVAVGTSDTGTIDIGGNASFANNFSATNTLGVDTTVEGLVDVSGTMDLNATLTVNGSDSTETVEELEVTKTNTFTDATITGTGTIDIAGNANFSGSNTVNVDTFIDGTLSLDNASLVGTGSFSIGDLVLVGDNTIGVDMDFGDMTSFDSNITFGSGTTVAEDVPTISFDSSITFTGNLGLDSAIIDSGDITVEGFGAFSGLNTINSTLTVQGADITETTGEGDEAVTTVIQTNTFTGATFDGTGSIDIDGNATFTGVNILNVATNIDGVLTLSNATLGGSLELKFDTVSFSGTNTISADTTILNIQNSTISNLTISNSTVNMFDANADTTVTNYVAPSINFNNSSLVLENSTLNIYGALTNSTYYGTPASMSIDSTSTLSTRDNFTLRGTLDLYGTLYVGGTMNIEKASTSNVATTASTVLTLHSGAEIITSDNKISISSGSTWKSHIGIILLGDYQQASDSALSGMDVVLGVGENSGDNLLYADFTFNNGTDYATGLVSLGKLTLNDNNLVTFNLAGLSSDTTTVLIEGLTIGTIDGNSAFIITDFAEGLIQFSSTGESIIEGLTLTTTDGYDYLTVGDNSILLTVTDSYGESITGLALDSSGFLVYAVPEPSTYAAIFGALALGLAMYRRRK